MQQIDFGILARLDLDQSPPPFRLRLEFVTPFTQYQNRTGLSTLAPVRSPVIPSWKSACIGRRQSTGQSVPVDAMRSRNRLERWATCSGQVVSMTVNLLRVSMLNDRNEGKLPLRGHRIDRQKWVGYGNYPRGGIRVLFQALSACLNRCASTRRPTEDSI